jgi:hypothetical protein
LLSEPTNNADLYFAINIIRGWKVGIAAPFLFKILRTAGVENYE